MPSERKIKSDDSVGRMKTSWTAWIAVVTSSIGMVLMVLTVVWRVNPVEGSVVPDFLTGNPLGQALLLVLLVTCMPVWIPTVFFVSFAGFPELANGTAVIVQGILYFVFGKLIWVWVEWFRTDRKSKSPT